MSFCTAIAAFKEAFFEALVGNHLPCKQVETTRAKRPVYGQPGPRRPYSAQPVVGHTQSAKPSHGKPHPQPYPICEQPLPYRPLYPLFR